MSSETRRKRKKMIKKILSKSNAERIRSKEFARELFKPMDQTFVGCLKLKFQWPDDGILIRVKG